MHTETKIPEGRLWECCRLVALQSCLILPDIRYRDSAATVAHHMTNGNASSALSKGKLSVTSDEIEDPIYRILLLMSRSTGLV